MDFENILVDQLILLRWNTKDFRYSPAPLQPKKSSKPKRKLIRFRMPSPQKQFYLEPGNYNEN
jgi:hypothetical protein